VSEVVFLRETPLMIARGYLGTLREAGHRLMWLRKYGGRNADRPWLRKVRMWCFVSEGRDAGFPDDAFVCGQIEAYLRWRKMDVDDDLVAAILAEVKKLLD
jgi:hypothetical protein